MAHKHTCLDCGRTIAEGDFDCELDRDHDFERCDDCTDAETLDDGAPVPSTFRDAWQEYEEGCGSEKPQLTRGELHDRITAAGLYYDRRSTRKQWVELFQRIFEGR